MRSPLIFILIISLAGPALRAGESASAPAATNPDLDREQDGLTNLEEMRRLTNPNSSDSDNDGLPDAGEAVGNDPVMRVPAARETTYAIIDLGPEYSPAGVNDQAEVLLLKPGDAPDTELGAIWKAGSVIPIGEGRKGSFRGPLLDGDVCFGTPDATTAVPDGNQTISENWRWVAATQIAAPAGRYYEHHILSSPAGVPYPGSPPQLAIMTPNIQSTAQQLLSAMKARIDAPLDGYFPAPDGAHHQDYGAELLWTNEIGENTFSAWTNTGQEITKTVDGIALPPFSLHVTMVLGGYLGLYDSFSSSFGSIAWQHTPIPLQPPGDLRINRGRFRIATMDGTPCVLSPTDGARQALPEAGSLADLNNKTTPEGPYMLGTIGGEAAIWCYNSGGFGSRRLGGYLTEPAAPIRLTNRKISNRLVVPLGDQVWRNGAARPVSELCGPGAASYQSWNIFQVSPNTHHLLAEATKSEGAPPHALLLVPADIAVDANRDGVIKFSGNFNSTDSDLQGKPVDKTTEDKPFRFWCNDDYDSRDVDYPDASSSNADDLKINCKRDLEDYARLHINIGGLQEAIVIGEIQIGLEWRHTTDSPSIKICRAVETDGGNEYVQGGADGNENWAESQILLPDASLLGPIGSSGDFKFPTSFWQSGSYGQTALSADHPNRYLLFDGITEGKGQLVLTFWKGTDKIGEGPGVWLDIKNVKKMYQRRDGSGQNQWPNELFEADPNETKQAIVFVHGWRMSPTGASSFAETMFKRLWHRGYKGRFAAFRWNTHWSSDFEWLPYVGGAIDGYLAEYNDSEHNAWLAGASLASFINNDLPSVYSKNVAAHSMGNIVMGSALLAGASVQNYALLQAAVPAACYDEDEGRIKQATPEIHTAGPLTLTMWDRLTPDNDADPSVRAVAYRGRLKDVSGNLVNFFLPEDYATSFAWEINNHETKPPDGALEANFHYWRFNQNGQKLFKYHYTYFPQTEVVDYYLTDPSQAYEAMPYACRTWGKAVGAWGPADGNPETGTRGSIDASVNLGESAFQLPDQTKSGFGEAHSGEFDARIQKLKLFYDTLMRRLDIETPNP